MRHWLKGLILLALFVFAAPAQAAVLFQCEGNGTTIVGTRRPSRPRGDRRDDVILTRCGNDVCTAEVASCEQVTAWATLTEFRRLASRRAATLRCS